MYFLRWTSQNEDQQHERRNCESEVCRAMALVHLQETGSATCSRTVHMGRSIPMAIKPKIGDTSPFFVGVNPTNNGVVGACPYLEASQRIFGGHKKLKSFLLLHLHSVIMSTIFISKALTVTTVDDVRSKFSELDLGVIDAIDMKEYDRDGTTFRKFWIHYSTYSTEPHAVGLMDRLKRNEEKQKNGEIIPAGDIPRIVYGVNRRTGNDMYWQVFSAKTKAEREAERAAKEAAVVAEKPKARIVM